jgi:hypothetical protein
MFRIRLGLMFGGVLAASVAAGPAVVHAGAERLTAPGSRVHVSLFRGSDLGTICYDILNPADEEGSPQHSTFVELRTEPVDVQTGLPAGDVVFAFASAPLDEVFSACATGMDPAVVTDIFANPGNYHLTQRDCFEFIGCFWTSDPLAAEIEAPHGTESPPANASPGTGPLPDTSAGSPNSRQPSVPAALLALGLLATGLTLSRWRRGSR